MRLGLVGSLLLGVLLASPCSAQAPGSGTDIELTGRAIGPLPVQPGRNSQFLVTVRNLGPRPTSFVNVASSWPAGPARLNIVPQSGPACIAYRDIDADPPIAYGLNVIVNVDLAPGQSASCVFELYVDVPLPLDASITYEAYQQSNFNPAFDPDFGNNRVTFGLGQAPVASIPTMGSIGAMLLGLALLLLTAGIPRRSRKSL